MDPIRFLSNSSTGKMGYYIAKAGIHNRLKVTFISGPVNEKFSSVDDANNIQVISTNDMLEAVLRVFSSNSILIMAAAPADFKIEEVSDKKIKKVDQSSLTLVPNPDILSCVNQYIIEHKCEHTYVVGFAAETHNTMEYAKKKLVGKNLDVIFLNNLLKSNSGFGKDTNELTVFFRNGNIAKWPMATKKDLGMQIIQTTLADFKTIHHSS